MVYLFSQAEAPLLTRRLMRQAGSITYRISGSVYFEKGRLRPPIFLSLVEV